MKNYIPTLSMLAISLICCGNMNCGASESLEYKKFPNSTELPKAAREDDIKKVKELLKAGFSTNSTWKYGWTPLMEVADYGHRDLLSFFIDYRDKDGQGPEIDQQDNLGRTALIYTVFTDKDRKLGRPGEVTKNLAYSLLKVGTDFTIQSKTDLCFVSLIEILPISKKKKKAMKEKSRKIVQDRWDVICSEWDSVSSIADGSCMPEDLVSLFFSFLYDEKNETLGIDKKAYKRLRESDNQDDSRNKSKKVCRSKRVWNRKRKNN
ncbi:MAG TPA: ankyrin repeat domain-containing protein [Candidatus Dependentiae bacterium]|nr:ankyrin repeat domain-containing protein [Candidatus Dependentiae bacterium]